MPKKRTGEPNIWSATGGGNDDAPFADSGSPRRYIPSPEKIREMAKKDKSGGRFTCPVCHESFTVNYGTFGKVGAFGEAQFFCKDCVRETKGFAKVK